MKWILTRITNSLIAPIQEKCYYLFLLFNLLSNGASAFYYHSGRSLFFIISLSFFYAYLEALIYTIIKSEWFRIVYVITLSFFFNCFILIDYYLIFFFHRIFIEDVIDIILETNHQEVSNFLETYLSFYRVALVIVSILAVNLLFIACSNILKKHSIHKITLLICGMGFSIFLIMVASFLRYHNGMAIPQMASVTRFSHTIFIANKRIKEIDLVKKACEKTVATSEDPTMPYVVVIIGESHSLYHSSLYGYPIHTNPLLGKRMNEGNLYRFEDAVSIDDHTHGVMKSVYSLDSLGVSFTNTPLFPSCFKSAGYHTTLYDNQYFVGEGINFLTDQTLSELLFDERNKGKYTYDGDMIDEITINKEPSLYVIHLSGQHYTYKNRYPTEFELFSKNQYDPKQFNESQREIIAHYDNACLYNDFVIDKVITKFEDTNSIVFYFSDHGEEVYELRDYIGHGDAAFSPDLKYQIRIPFLIYVSDEYRLKHASFCQSLGKAVLTPITTDDISHEILRAASIRTPAFSPHRCFTDPTYPPEKSRIVLHSIKYNP